MNGQAVVLRPLVWHVTPAAELLREWVKEELPRWYGRMFDHILLMAGSKANYLEDKVKNEVLGAVSFVAPTPVFFGIWGSAGSIGDTFNGGTAGEVTGGAYDRVSVTNNTTNFPTVSGTAKLNGTDIAWAQATANWNGGATVNQVGVLDGNLKTSADNGLLWADFTTPKSVLSGDTAKILTNDFSWTED